MMHRRSAVVVPLVLAATGLLGVGCKSKSELDVATAASAPEPSGAGTEPPPASAPASDPAAPVAQSGAAEAPPNDLPITGSEGAPATEANPSAAAPPNPVVPGSTATCAPAEGGVPALALTPVATGLSQPLFVTSAPGDASRLFVVEKAGTVRVINDGELLEEPFVDVRSRVRSELAQGLLGLAFHPDYANNGLFYLHFTANGEDEGSEGGAAAGASVIAELRVDPENPNVASLGSERQVLTVDRPEGNHNGGMIAFGPDRQLWIGLGDGGGSNDPYGTQGNGQALDTALGKLLRIDVDAREIQEAYGVSPGNMIGEGINPTIWAYGLRDPWRFSFDACRGDVYVADVGQTAFEEINFVAAGSPAGVNFGWRRMEGNGCRPGEVDCESADAQLTLPIDGYSRDVGRAVVGGYVYRGNALPGLRGYYIYGDYGTGRLFRFRAENGQAVDRVEMTSELAPVGGTEDAISSFGQDNAGEMYIVTLAPGAVYRITAR